MKIDFKPKGSDQTIGHQIGKYLVLGPNNIIYLLNTREPLVNIRFQHPATGKQIAQQIHNLFQDRLGYLGWVDWLGGLNQIANREINCWIFADFLSLLEDKATIITEEMCKECMKIAIQQNTSMKYKIY